MPRSSAQRVCAGIVECPEDALSIFDRQRDDSSLQSQRPLKEGTCRLVDDLYELAHVFVRDPQAGEIHGDERTP